MAKWLLQTKRADFHAIAEKFNIDPVIARVLRNRDIVDEDEIRTYLYGTLKDLHAPGLLKDGEKAAAVLQKKIEEKKAVRIIGDYDIDGVCATYILWKGLSACGARVDTALPDRVKDGYGLNESLVRQAHEDGIDTILTCDNGIAAIEQIACAKDLGLTVIVTDHHEMPYEEGEGGEKRWLRSAADAVVNPKQPDCTYPFQGLCGAAIAYKLVELLVPLCGADGGVLRELLEFAAFATVGDVMELRGENRLLVKYGLKAIAGSKNPGMRALIAVNGLEGKALSAYHIGFVLGPCVNATGRLDTAERALALFMAETEAEAAGIAGDLKSLNDSRKAMTNEYVHKAIAAIEAEGLSEDKVLVVYLPDCHESIAGIIAGRLRERYYRPVFVLTGAEEGVKGSGRSIEAYHMFDEMSKCRELFTKFGGHSQAAGLSMPEENVALFRQRINGQAELTEDDLTEKVRIDVDMPFSYVTEELIRQFSLLEPCGMGNSRPLFAQKELCFSNGRILGKQKNVAKFSVSDKHGRRMEAVYFGDITGLTAHITEKFGKEQADRLFSGGPCDVTLSIVYYPAINEYMGRRNIQLTIQEYC